MRKEDFFEILGELDDNIVQAAKAPVKKKMNWKILGTMAACLTLTCIAFGRFSATKHYSNSIGEVAEAPSEEAPAMEEAPAEMAPMEEACAADLAPMVYVNDTLYIQSSDQKGYPEWIEEFIYLGKIESAISSESAPEQNFQANDPIIGCDVYQYGENIVVKINGSYWLYVKYGESEVNWDDLSEQEKEELDPMYNGE